MTEDGFEKVRYELEKGYVYTYRRDKLGRPINIIDLPTHNRNSAPTDLFIEVLDFMNTYTISNGMIPGKIE